MQRRAPIIVEGKKKNEVSYKINGKRNKGKK